MSLPDTVLADRAPHRKGQGGDLDFALRLGVDWVALSFVQRGEDVNWHASSSARAAA